MSRRDDERVADILDAADEIAAVIEPGRDAWDKDRLRQLAAERLLEIIGEAANSLSDEFRARYPGIPGATSSACGSCSRTIITGLIQAKCGKSLPPRSPSSFTTSAPPDDRLRLLPVITHR